MTKTKQDVVLSSFPDILALIGRLGGGLNNVSVGLAEVAKKDVAGEKVHALELRFNGSAERGIALSAFKWPFPLEAVPNSVGQTKLKLVKSFKEPKSVPGWLLANAVASASGSEETTFDLNDEDRTMLVTHKRASSTLPLIPAMPTAEDESEDKDAKPIDLKVLGDVLAAFPPRFSLVAPISNDKAVSDLYVMKHGSGIIAGFATATTAVFSYIPKTPLSFSEPVSYDMDTIGLLRSLPSLSLAKTVSIGKRSASIRGRTSTASSGLVWAAKLRLRPSEVALSPEPVMTLAAKLIKEAMAIENISNFPRVQVKEFADVIKKAIGFAADVTDVRLSGDTTSLIVTAGKESRSRSRMLVGLKKRIKSNMIVSSLGLPAATLKHLLTVFDGDTYVYLRCMPDGKSLIMTQKSDYDCITIAIARGLT